MTDTEILQLREHLRKELQHLPESVYPYFSYLSKSEEGLDKAEAIVLAYVAQNSITVMAAIAQLEAEYAG